MEIFMTLADKLGFPAACLVVLVIGLWMAIRWVGLKVLLPVTNSHIGLIEKAKETNEANAKTLLAMSQTSEVTAKMLVKIGDQQEEKTRLIRELHDKVVKGVKRS